MVVGTTRDKLHAAPQQTVGQSARIGDDLALIVAESLAAQGAATFGRYCVGCHGVGVIAGGDALVGGATARNGLVASYSTSLAGMKWGLVAPGGSGTPIATVLAADRERSRLLAELDNDPSPLRIAGRVKECRYGAKASSPWPIATR